MKTKVLVDLTKIGNPLCGFGTIALTYEELFANYQGDEFEFIFLVPKDYVPRFPDKVTYVHATKWSRYFSCLLPKVKIWHTTTQQLSYLRMKRGTKQIFTVHDLNFLYEKQWYSILKHLYQMRCRIKRASIVTAISGFVKQDILDHIPVGTKNIQVIYNGVGRIDNKPESKPAFATGRPFFFSIGQIRKKKNFHVLLDVMQAFPEYDLFICGDDHFEYAQYLRKEIKVKRLSNVFVTGAITVEEKVWMYRNCEAFLFPSTLEGFGIPVLEAMQFGKAVFSSNCSSLPEICGEHAYIWESFDTEHMIRLIKDNLFAFYANPIKSEAARAYAHSFSYERHIEEYLKLYRKLLEE